MMVAAGPNERTDSYWHTAMLVAVVSTDNHDPDQDPGDRSDESAARRGSVPPLTRTSPQNRLPELSGEARNRIGAWRSTRENGSTVSSSS
jgi:hypothetical protein